MPNIQVSNRGLRDFPDSHNRTIEEILNETFSGIDKRICVYSVGSTHSHKFTNKKELYIFNYSSLATDAKKPTLHTINDAITAFGRTITVEKMFEPNDGGKLIHDETGMVVAQYYFEHKIINIFVDLLGAPNDDKLHILREITRIVGTMIREEGDEESWVHAKDKSYIINRTREMMRENHNTKVSQARDQRQREESNVESYRQELTKAHIKLAEAMRILDSAESMFDENVGKLLADLELLAQYDKIADIRIEGKFIHIHTKDLIITEPRQGTQYVGGRFIIKVRMSDSKITFHADGHKGKRGYWTDRDPHPHVNGDSGTACLGSVAPTIAELCSQEQIYALGIVLISFLESVNIDDSAGKKVVNWPKIPSASKGVAVDLPEELDDEEHDEETDGEE